MAEHCARHTRHWIWCGPCRRARTAAPRAPQPPARPLGREYDDELDADLPAAALLVSDLMPCAEPELPQHCDSTAQHAPSSDLDLQPGTHHTTSYLPDAGSPAAPDSTFAAPSHTFYDHGGGTVGYDSGSPGGADASSCGSSDPGSMG